MRPVFLSKKKGHRTFKIRWPILSLTDSVVVSLQRYYTPKIRFSSFLEQPGNFFRSGTGAGGRSEEKDHRWGRWPEKWRSAALLCCLRDDATVPFSLSCPSCTTVDAAVEGVLLAVKSYLLPIFSLRRYRR